MGVAAIGLVKLSVCFLYWHLFARVVFRRFLIIWMVVIIVWTISFLLSIAFECGTYWKAFFGQARDIVEHCQSAVPIGYAMVATDVATDLITLAIPIPVILQMRMDTHTKILTLLTFMVGALYVP